MESILEANMDAKLGVKKEVKPGTKRKQHLKLQEAPLCANKEIKMEENLEVLPNSNREDKPNAKQGAKQT